MSEIFALFLLLNKNPFLSSIKDTIIIGEWLYLGPFSISSREGIIGVDECLELCKDFEPDKNLSYPSILAQGGKVGWQKLKADNGEVKIAYRNVLWDTLQDYYGAAGLLSAGYACGDFYNEDIKNAIIIAKGISSYKLNGNFFPGDPYEDNYPSTPVVLEPGKNRVIVKLSGFGDHDFVFKIAPVPAPLMVVTKDITKPDFIKGEITDTWIGIPIVNTTDKRLFNIQLTVSGKGIKTTTHKINSIMPLSAVKIPIRIESGQEINTEKDSILINAAVVFGDFITHESFGIEMKVRSEARCQTFISKIDNSCQYYAILPPKNYNEDSAYALIMTCHGAGVKAQNQVKAYTQKDWAFVVAPTNRRRFGFDWQDWGRLDFLEVLEDVKRKFKIDTNRIYLTGHSMGGHGVWHIGLSYPDIFAAIAPSAGWICFQLYIPWFLQKSEIFTPPELIKFRDMVLREDNPLLFLENACNLPVYILQGGADDNVPPIQGRMFYKYLNALDYDVIYNEIKDQRHWWNIDSTPEVDCIDSEELVEFLRGQTKIAYPLRIVFTTSDIEHSDKCHWIKIDELVRLYEEAHIDASILGHDFKKSGLTYTYLIDATNVARFTVNIKHSLIEVVDVPTETLEFIINGQKIVKRFQGECAVSFVQEHKGYRIVNINPGGSLKRKGLYGPIKRAYFNPFLLVYGTIGDSSSTENNLHQARLQSYTWRYRANGFVEILPDTELTEKIIQKYNLILFGNAETNSILKGINHKLPIKIEEKHIIIGKEKLKQKDLCLIEIYPNPLNSENFILLYSPTSKEAEKIMGLFTPLYSGSGLPDYIVYDKAVLRYGWAGVIAAGFFDKNWKFDKRLAYIKN